MPVELAVSFNDNDELYRKKGGQRDSRGRAFRHQKSIRGKRAVSLLVSHQHNSLKK